MDTILINPTLADVNSALAAGASDANRRQRARTAELHVTQADWATPELSLRNGGEGVANAYRGAASTTVVGCSWATDDGGRRVVRLYAKRVLAPHSSYGRQERCPFGYTQSAWDKIEPRRIVLAGLLPMAAAELVPAADEFKTVGPAIDSPNLPALIDWAQEHDLPVDHAAAYHALLTTSTYATA